MGNTPNPGGKTERALIDACLNCPFPDCTGNCKRYSYKEANLPEESAYIGASRLYDYHGEQLRIADIAKREGINYGTLYRRLNAGMPVSYAINGRRGTGLMKPVVRIDRDGNVLERYDSAADASKHCGMTSAGIKHRCRHLVKHEFRHHSYTFRYEEEIRGDTT